MFWLDLDTIVWARHSGVETLLDLSRGSDLIAQHDFHRFNVYFNAGVMLIRKSDWTHWLLETAYNTRRVMLLRKLVYNMEEQDALNIAAARSMQRPPGTPGWAEGYKVRILTYPRLWSFTHEALEEDGRVAAGIATLHFPNCREGRCAAEYVRYAELALAEQGRPGSTLAFQKSAGAVSDEMPLRTSWLFGGRRLAGDGRRL